MEDNNLLRRIIVGLLIFSLSLDITGISVKRQLQAQVLPLSNPQKAGTSLGIDSLDLKDMQLEKTFKGSLPFQIILIRDIHAEPEAQFKIADSLKEICKQLSAKVFIEGASGVVRPLLYQSFPDKNIRRKASKTFVEKGYLTGAEFAAIEMGLQSNLKIYGVENINLYIKNLKAFWKTRQLHKKNETMIERIEVSLKELKDKCFSLELQKLDFMEKSLNDKNFNLKEIIGSLEPLLFKEGWVWDKWKNLAQVYEILKTGESINQNAVQEELQLLFKELEKKLPKNQLQQLVESGLTYRLGRISAFEYFEDLEKIVKTQMSLEIFDRKYPHLEKWKQLSLKQEKFNFSKAQEELQDLINALFEKISTREGVIELRNLDKVWFLFQKLVLLKLSKGDFTEIKKWNLEENFDQWHHQLIKLNDVSVVLSLFDIQSFKELLQTAESFYGYAQKRDQVLINNTLKRLSKSDEVGVLITGGFHTDGIQQELEKEKISYVTWTPQIRNFSKENFYEKIMMDRSFNLEEAFSSKRFILRDNSDELRRMLGIPVDKVLKVLNQKAYTQLDQEILEGLLREADETRIGTINETVSSWMRERRLAPDCDALEVERVALASERYAPAEVFLSLTRLDSSSHWERILAKRVVREAFGGSKKYEGLVYLTETMMKKSHQATQAIVIKVIRKMMDEVQIFLKEQKKEKAEEKVLMALDLLIYFLQRSRSYFVPSYLLKEVLLRIKSDPMKDLGPACFEKIAPMIVEMERYLPSAFWMREAVWMNHIELIKAIMRQEQKALLDERVALYERAGLYLSGFLNEIKKLAQEGHLKEALALFDLVFLENDFKEGDFLKEIQKVKSFLEARKRLPDLRMQLLDASKIFKEGLMIKDFSESTVTFEEVLSLYHSSQVLMREAQLDSFEIKLGNRSFIYTPVMLEDRISLLENLIHFENAIVKWDGTQVEHFIGVLKKCFEKTKLSDEERLGFERLYAEYQLIAEIRLQIMQGDLPRAISRISSLQNAAQALPLAQFFYEHLFVHLKQKLTDAVQNSEAVGKALLELDELFAIRLPGPVPASLYADMSLLEERLKSIKKAYKLYQETLELIEREEFEGVEQNAERISRISTIWAKILRAKLVDEKNIFNAKIQERLDEYWKKGEEAFKRVLTVETERKFDKEALQTALENYSLLLKENSKNRSLKIERSKIVLKRNLIQAFLKIDADYASINDTSSLNLQYKKIASILKRIDIILDTSSPYQEVLAEVKLPLTAFRRQISGALGEKSESLKFQTDQRTSRDQFHQAFEFFHMGFTFTDAQKRSEYWNLSRLAFKKVKNDLLFLNLTSIDRRGKLYDDAWLVQMLDFINALIEFEGISEDDKNKRTKLEKMKTLMEASASFDLRDTEIKQIQGLIKRREFWMTFTDLIEQREYARMSEVLKQAEASKELHDAPEIKKARQLHWKLAFKPINDLLDKTETTRVSTKLKVGEEEVEKNLVDLRLERVGELFTEFLLDEFQQNFSPDQHRKYEGLQKRWKGLKEARQIYIRAEEELRKGSFSSVKRSVNKIKRYSEMWASELKGKVLFAEQEKHSEIMETITAADDLFRYALDCERDTDIKLFKESSDLYSSAIAKMQMCHAEVVFPISEILLRAHFAKQVAEVDQQLDEVLSKPISSLEELTTLNQNVLSLLKTREDSKLDKTAGDLVQKEDIQEDIRNKRIWKNLLQRRAQVLWKMSFLEIQKAAFLEIKEDKEKQIQIRQALLVRAEEPLKELKRSKAFTDLAAQINSASSERNETKPLLKPPRAASLEDRLNLMREAKTKGRESLKRKDQTKDPTTIALRLIAALKQLVPVKADDDLLAQQTQRGLVLIQLRVIHQAMINLSLGEVDQKNILEFIFKVLNLTDQVETIGELIAKEEAWKNKNDLSLKEAEMRRFQDETQKKNEALYRSIIEKIMELNQDYSFEVSDQTRINNETSFHRLKEEAESLTKSFVPQEESQTAFQAQIKIRFYLSQITEEISKTRKSILFKEKLTSWRKTLSLIQLFREESFYEKIWDSELLDLHGQIESFFKVHDLLFKHIYQVENMAEALTKLDLAESLFPSNIDRSVLPWSELRKRLDVCKEMKAFYRNSLTAIDGAGKPVDALWVLKVSLGMAKDALSARDYDLVRLGLLEVLSGCLQKGFENFDSLVFEDREKLLLGLTEMVKEKFLDETFLEMIVERTFESISQYINDSQKHLGKSQLNDIRACVHAFQRCIRTLDDLMAMISVSQDEVIVKLQDMKDQVNLFLLIFLTHAQSLGELNNLKSPLERVQKLRVLNENIFGEDIIIPLLKSHEETIQRIVLYYRQQWMQALLHLAITGAQNAEEEDHFLNELTLGIHFLNEGFEEGNALLVRAVQERKMIGNSNLLNPKSDLIQFEELLKIASTYGGVFFQDRLSSLINHALSECLVLLKKGQLDSVETFLKLVDKNRKILTLNEDLLRHVADEVTTFLELRRQINEIKIALKSDKSSTHWMALAGIYQKWLNHAPYDDNIFSDYTNLLKKVVQDFEKGLEAATSLEALHEIMSTFQFNELFSDESEIALENSLKDSDRRKTFLEIKKRFVIIRNQIMANLNGINLDKIQDFEKQLEQFPFLHVLSRVLVPVMYAWTQDCYAESASLQGGTYKEALNKSFEALKSVHSITSLLKKRTRIFISTERSLAEEGAHTLGILLQGLEDAQNPLLEQLGYEVLSERLVLYNKKVSSLPKSHQNESEQEKVIQAYLRAYCESLRIQFEKIENKAINKSQTGENIYQSYEDLLKLEAAFDLLNAYQVRFPEITSVLEILQSDCARLKRGIWLLSLFFQEEFSNLKLKKLSMVDLNDAFRVLEYGFEIQNVFRTEEPVLTELDLAVEWFKYLWSPSLDLQKNSEELKLILKKAISLLARPGPRAKIVVEIINSFLYSQIHFLEYLIHSRNYTEAQRHINFFLNLIPQEDAYRDIRQKLEALLTKAVAPSQEESSPISPDAPHANGADKVLENGSENGIHKPSTGIIPPRDTEVLDQWVRNLPGHWTRDLLIPGLSRPHFLALHGGYIDGGEKPAVTHVKTNQAIARDMVALDAVPIETVEGIGILSKDSDLIRAMQSFLKGAFLNSRTKNALKGVRVVLLPEPQVDEKSGPKPNPKQACIEENDLGSVYAHYGQKGQDPKGQTSSIFFRAELVKRLLALPEKGPQALAALIKLESYRHEYREDPKKVDKRSSAEVVKAARLSRDELRNLVHSLAEVEADILLEEKDNTQAIINAAELLEHPEMAMLDDNTVIGKLRGPLSTVFTRKIADRIRTTEDDRAKRYLMQIQAATEKIHNIQIASESELLISFLKDKLREIPNIQTLGIDLLMGEIIVTLADGKKQSLKLSSQVIQALSLMVGKLAGSVERIVIDIATSEQRGNFLEKAIILLMSPDQKTLTPNERKIIGELTAQRIEIEAVDLIHISQDLGNLARITPDVIKASEYFAQSLDQRKHPILIEAELIKQKLASLTGDDREAFLKHCQKYYAVLRTEKVEGLEEDKTQEHLWKNYDAFIELDPNYKVAILNATSLPAEIEQVMVIKLNADQQNSDTIFNELTNFATYIADIGKKEAREDGQVSKMFSILIQALYEGNPQEAQSILSKMSLEEILVKSEILFPPINQHFQKDLDAFIRAKRTIDAMA